MTLDTTLETTPATISSGFAGATAAVGCVSVTAEIRAAARGATVVESVPAGASATVKADVSAAAAAGACTFGADGVAALVLDAATEADALLFEVDDDEEAAGVESGSLAGGSATSVVGAGLDVGCGVAVGSGVCVVGAAVSVGDADGSVSSGGVGVLVLPDVPVVVWALTTTPGATVLDVVLLVVVAVVAVVPGWVVVVDPVFAGTEGVDGPVPAPVVAVPVVPAGSADCTLPAGELEDAESSASATPCPVAIAVPTPRATARRPTRPT
ncbi:MAG TPA: hypothetical protein VGO30_10080 [Mycobacterium sp.]|jgi:hypothetical protein|nr:hypothetical protein [Mycobacterium sp.]